MMPLLLLILLLPATALAGITADTCAPFYQALQLVPHESISRQEGGFLLQTNGTEVTGCLVVMVTNDARLGSKKLKDFSADPGTASHRAGWRSNLKYLADGPGTSVAGLEKDDALCLVYTEQSAYIDDAGRIVQSEVVTVRVECFEP